MVCLKDMERGISGWLMLMGSYIVEASFGIDIGSCGKLGQRERAVKVGEGCDRAKHVRHGCTPC